MTKDEWKPDSRIGSITVPGGCAPRQTQSAEGSERQSRPAAPGAASLVRIYVTLINVNTSAHFLFSFLYIQ